MRRAIKRLWTITALGLAACQPSYGEVDFKPLSTPPVTVTIRPYEIDIPVGIAVAVEATLRSDNRNEYDSSDRLDLIPDNRDILVVDRRSDRRQFVLVGVAPGTTCLRVIIDGHQADCIDAAVTAQ